MPGLDTTHPARRPAGYQLAALLALAGAACSHLSPEAYADRRMEEPLLPPSELPARMVNPTTPTPTPTPTSTPSQEAMQGNVATQDQGTTEWATWTQNGRSGNYRWVCANGFNLGARADVRSSPTPPGPAPACA